MIFAEHALFQTLTDDRRARIHEAALAVLEKTGLVMAHPKAQEALSGAGCAVDADGRVRFPARAVEDAIRKAPKSVTVYSRLGEPRLHLEGRKVYYGTVTSLPFIAESSGARRPYTLQDCREMTVVMDALDTLEFATATGNSSDAPPAVSDVHEIACILEHSPKPVLITTHDEAGLRTLLDIGTVLKGGAERLRREPFLLYCVCPISPLQYPEGVLGKMMLAVENGLPFVAVPAPGAGATSPVTVAGTLVCGTAEILGALTLAQTLHPGAPFLFGGFFTSMDMGHMIMNHGAPEFCMLNAAQAEMARHYGVPSFSSAGCTDAHTLDVQAGFEIGFNTLTAALSGANLVHAMSVIGSGTAVSRELLVLSDEFIRFTKRFCAGLAVDAEHLAVEDIATTGPGGSFLESDLTLRLFKEEIWTPRLFVRDYFDKWVSAGRPAMMDHLKRECERILREHHPVPVREDALREMRRIIQSSDRVRLKGA